jgi:hypothetical protein
MERCAHNGCNCNDAKYESAGQLFCDTTCADGDQAHDLADAMCSCGHDGCCSAAEATA